jgi:NAD(P)-dependent dehydrogenase (short-subunit alcohol dehydrogenase family)
MYNDGVDDVIIIIGSTDTDMAKGASEEMLDFARRLSPFNRLGTIADLGDAIALFASESARWISGQHIFVSVCFALISHASLYLLACTHPHTDSPL